MAKNTQKRIPVKWIRDRAKSAYQKQTHCFVCNTTLDLELHHLHSITRLLEKYCVKNNIVLDTDSKVLEIRDDFIEKHYVEIYELVYTLCNTHHVKLHTIYGKSPSEASVLKQKKYLETQRDKHNGLKVEKTNYFSELL